MLYARQPTLPIGSNSSTVSLEEMTGEEAAEAILEKAAIREDLATKAVENITKAQQKHKEDYKAKRKYVEPTTLKPGDYVVLKASARKGKLEPSAGPEVFKIEKFTDEHKAVAILNDAGTPPKRWKENVSRIALYADLVGCSTDQGWDETNA